MTRLLQAKCRQVLYPPAGRVLSPVHALSHPACCALLFGLVLCCTNAAAAVFGPVLLVWAYRATRRRRLARQMQRAQSERGYFERFQQACRGEEASSIYNALTQWTSRCGGDRQTALTLQGIARLSSDPALADHLDRLQYAVANREPYAQGLELDRLMGDVRKRLQSPDDLSGGSLRELNPSGDKAFGG